MAQNFCVDMNIDMEQLQYPTGRYQKVETYSKELEAGWIKILLSCPDELEKAVAGLSDEQLNTPYREGGWTVRQLVHHIADSHLHAYVRAKLALTEMHPAIKPYDEKLWAETKDSTTMNVAVSVAMVRSVHLRLCFVLAGLQASDWEREYYHPEHKRNIPVWEIAALYAWHSQHHLAHITRLRERMGW